ncbi:MAG: hypothetical protein ACRCTZ_18460 [Sarcina sp.]
MIDKTKDLESLLNATNNLNELTNLINKKKDSIDTLNFPNYFSNLCKEKKLKKGEIINNSTISRSYCYEILRGYKIPDRDNAIKLCIAANLTIEETNRVLKLTNNSILYPKISRDMFIMFCIKKEYSLTQTDIVLDENNLKPLISCD